MPKAFVIMPFNEEFDSVYQELIKLPLEEKHGFDVGKANDMDSQQNILRTIMAGISDSDVIIADLTTSNPNVFYELGIAHAVGKPVVLLTQSIEDVPFDLQSYNLIQYSTHISGFNKAKEDISSRVAGIVDRTLPFGDPVSDFYPEGENSTPTARGIESDGDSEIGNWRGSDGPGLIDRVVETQSKYEELTTIMNNLSEFMQQMGEDVGNSTDRIARINANPNQSTAAAIQSELRRLASKIAPFNDQMEISNPQTAQIIKVISDNWEWILSSAMEQPEELENELPEPIPELTQLHEIVDETRTSYSSMLETIESLPHMERRLNREKERLSRVIRAFLDNLQMFDASILRILSRLEPNKL